ncbi:major histocompatibility complex class I-related gene protein-like [Triplophysa rosa]|uniref:Major histocompatibility complex class I-related gene protein-like protein n=1 Tax=Triplophysa rosa TaxID=992332 RepID=A0A9W7T3M5_TRIRA|nr:major histocompatibility complex class I-related gene protein-like [Triplophysa rosa]XP_057181925.1 major histocompatibility complex class I-related gene protein-like [Triplophysa rosa]KAI7790918.1 putative major histocompatibility complex class I-related gene protein-like protein [Triplophysa rosa]
MWNEDTEIRKYVQQIYKINIDVLMSRFNQSDGIHTYQRTYGCSWDSETEESYGFDLYGYDGEDFITLDVKEARYIAALPQAIPTMHKWNQDRGQIELLQHYYKYECVYWLKYFLNLRKDALKSTAPEVFLLQKSPSSAVYCHATGFYPSDVRISWMKNGEDQYEDVEIGALLPNEDGTFQRTSTLLVDPEYWKKDEYICVVEHKMKNIQKMLSVHEIKSNDGPDILFFVALSVVVMLIMIIPFALKCAVRPKNLQDTFEHQIHYNTFDKHA